MNDRLPLDRIQLKQKKVKCIVENKDKYARKDAIIENDELKGTTKIRLSDNMYILFRTSELKRNL